jgi:hypothetical protein
MALAGLSLISVLQASPAAAQPGSVRLSDLALLPGDAQVSPAAGTQESPRIAAGGGGYLVVWTDQRSALTPLAAFSGGPYLSPDIGSMHDIYAARLDASGALLDSFPILVSQRTQNQGFPAVAWNGQNWLVAWSGQTDMACCPNARIFAARVSPAGTVLDPAPIAVATESQVDGWYGPAVASDGNDWSVVYREWDSSGISLLVGKRIAADGTLLDAAARELRHDTWNSYPIHPDIVFAGDEYLLVWTEMFPTGIEGAVRGQRLTPELSTIGGLINLNPYSPTKGKNPHVATDGTGFFVAWFEDRYFGWAQIFATRVSHAGTVQDPAGIAVTPYSGYAQFTPQVAWDATRWFVGYNINDLLVSRVSPVGKLLDTSGIVVKTAAGADCQPAMVARAGGGVRFAWKDSRAAGPNPEDIYSIHAAATGAAGSEACLSLAAPRQTSAQLVAGGSGHLLVFRSQISGRSRIVAQRLDAGGMPLDAEPIEIAAGPNLSSPAAAWNGSLFLITWQDATVPIVYARRLRTDGTFADPAPITLLTAYSPVVAALGDIFLVAGVFDPNPHFSEPQYVRVRGLDGTKLDASPFVIGRSFAVAPSVTRLGTRWLLMWEEHVSHDNPASAVVGALIAADGSVAASVSATVAGTGLEYSPSVATGRDAAIVAWQDTRGGNSSRDIYAQRLLPDGTRLDGNGIRISAAANNQRSPALAWDGQEFVVCYGDDRNEGTPGIQQFQGDVYASRMDEQGRVLDSDGFAVSRESIMESNPVAGGSGATAFLGCSIFQPEKPYASYRIGLRTAVPDLPTSVDAREIGGPLRLRVAPNPFGGEVGITFALSRVGSLRAVVHDMRGREVRRICDGVMPAGPLRLAWDGCDARGVPVASGVYWISVAAEGRMMTARVARLR